MDLSNQQILFIRYKDNGYFSLIKLSDGQEEIFADNIVFADAKKVSVIMDISAQKCPWIFISVTEINLIRI